MSSNRYIILFFCYLGQRKAISAQGVAFLPLRPAFVTVPPPTRRILPCHISTMTTTTTVSTTSQRPPSTQRFTFSWAYMPLLRAILSTDLPMMIPTWASEFPGGWIETVMFYREDFEQLGINLETFPELHQPHLDAELQELLLHPRQTYGILSPGLSTIPFVRWQEICFFLIQQQ